MGQAEADRQREKAANSVVADAAINGSKKKWMWCVPNSNKNALSPLAHPPLNVSWMCGSPILRHNGTRFSCSSAWPRQYAVPASTVEEFHAEEVAPQWWLMLLVSISQLFVERIVILDTLGIMSIDILSGGCWLHVRCQQEKMVDSLLERLKKKAGSEAGCTLPPWSLP